MAQATKEEIYNAVKYAVHARLGGDFGTELSDKEKLALTNDSDDILYVTGDSATGDLVVKDIYPGREIARFKIVPA